MLNLFRILLPLLFALTCQAQENLQDSIATERTRLHKTHMRILGVWAGANIIHGSISAANSQKSEHYFHQMNAYWNFANLAIAGLGFLQAKKQKGIHYTTAENLIEQHKIEKILLLNTGLDLAYIMTGFYLREKGSDRSVGYGNSLLLQGGFLFIFDIIQYANHRRNGKFLEKHLDKWQMEGNLNGIGLTYRFP